MRIEFLYPTDWTAALAAICVLEATRAGAQNPAMISPREQQDSPANPPRPSLRTLRLHIQTTAATNKRAKQSPNSKVEEREDHAPDPPNPRPEEPRHDYWCPSRAAPVVRKLGFPCKLMSSPTGIEFMHPTGLM